MMILFMAGQKSEVCTIEQIGAAINRAVEYGFLRKLKQDEGEMLEIYCVLNRCWSQWISIP